MNARPRVGIIALATPDNGGVFQYTQAVIDALSARRDVDYVIFSQHSDFDARGLEMHGVTFERHAPATLLTMSAAVLAGRGLPMFVPRRDRQLYDSVDSFFVPSVLPYPQLFFDKPYVVTIHDLQERHFPAFFSTVERLQRGFTNRTVARRARRVLCESQFVKRDIERFLGVDGARIDVVPAPPPAEISAALPGDEEVRATRQRYGLQSDYFFYPAQFWQHKNQLTLVRAFARVHVVHPELRLVLTGAPRHNYGVVMNEARALGLGDVVSHVGQLPYADLRALFRGARALVMPSLHESISIPVYEAFALGVPVCVSNVVALPEQAGDAALLFDPHDAAAMAAEMLRIVADPALAATLVERGRRRLAELLREPYGDRLSAVLRAGLL